MVMELDKILDEMESILSDGWRIPLVNKVMIDENEITMVMDKLRAAVPLEVKRAHDLLEEQKNIIDKSREPTTLWNRPMRKGDGSWIWPKRKQTVWCARKKW